MIGHSFMGLYTRVNTYIVRAECSSRKAVQTVISNK